MEKLNEKDLVMIIAALDRVANEAGEKLEDLLSEDEYNGLLKKATEHAGASTLEDYKHVFMKIVRELTK